MSWQVESRFEQKSSPKNRIYPTSPKSKCLWFSPSKAIDRGPGKSLQCSIPRNAQQGPSSPARFFTEADWEERWQPQSCWGSRILLYHKLPQGLNLPWYRPAGQPTPFPLYPSTNAQPITLLRITHPRSPCEKDDLSSLSPSPMPKYPNTYFIF